MEYWRLLAHNNWFTVNLLGIEVRLCARCSGYFLGFLTPFLVLRKVNALGISALWVWHILCIILALPLVVDWITQSWGLRRSSNWVRLSTGFLLGFDVFIYFGLGLSIETKKFIFVIAALMVTLIGYVGKLRGSNSISNLFG